MTAAVGAGVGAFLASLTPIADGDIFWHLAAGRQMVQQHAWLRTDPFTLSAAGRPWVDVHWLFQLVAYGVFSAAGLAGLVLAKAAIVGIGALALARAAWTSAGARERLESPPLGAAVTPVDQRLPPPTARPAVRGEGEGRGARSSATLAVALLAPALVGALFLARHLILPRPVVVTLLMLALFFAALEGARNGNRRALFALPVLQVVWTNCQGLAALGPALIGAYLIAGLVSRTRVGARLPVQSERSLPLRRLAVVLALCAVASLVTPYGLGAAVLPARLLARLMPAGGNLFSTAIAENVPPFVLERTAPELAAHFKWFLGVLAICFVLARPRLYLSHALVFVGMCVLALMANRNVLLFYWLATPIAVLAITPGLRRLLVRVAIRSRARPVRAVAVIAWGLALCATLALVASAAIHEPSIAQPTPFHFPVESTQRLVQARAAGPIFAPDHVGGYLSFLAPALRPYIDTRLILHTGDEYATFLAAVDDPAVFDALAARYRFRWVVLTTTYPDRYLGLVQRLAANPHWRLIFTDGSEVLFARAGGGDGDHDDVVALRVSDPSNTDATLARLAARFADRPVEYTAARLNLARLLIVVGETRQALRVLTSLDSRAAVQLRARAHLVAGDLRAAEALARTLLLDDERDKQSLALLAQIEILRGKTDLALPWLRRALDVDPYDPEARGLLEGLTAAH